jgi:hypothetical protein
MSLITLKKDDDNNNKDNSKIMIEIKNIINEKYKVRKMYK